MILNQDNFPCISDFAQFTVLYRSYSSYFSLKSWNDKDYWYFEICNGTWLSHNDLHVLIPNEILHKIKNDNQTFLCVCNWIESFHTIADIVYLDIIIKYDIPPKKIILMSCSRNLCDEVIAIAKKYNLDTCQVEYTGVFEFQAKTFCEDYRDDLNFYLSNQKMQNFEKTFINLNRHLRPHRAATVWLLYVKNLISKGYVSCPNFYKVDRDFFYEEILTSIEDDYELANCIHDNKTILMELSDLFVDRREYFDINNEQWNDPNFNLDFNSIKEFYNNSFLTLVSEVNFNYKNKFTEGIFLSEKTFKPIIYHKPFILISVPHSLKLLKDLGYKTFHPWIDESYDDELNNGLRMKKIIEEVARLASLSNTDLYKLNLELQPIIKHNFLNLINKNEYIIKTL